MKQGEANGTGHYSGIKLFNIHNFGNIRFNDFENASKIEYNNNEEVQMMNTNQLNVLIFNCRTIREYYKKLLLIDILRSKDIDIALLQETFLIEEDKLYSDGYKIYRADNQIRRKGVAILVNTKIDVDCTKLAADPNGRFIKIRIKNRDSMNSINISSLYPETNGNIENINETAMEAQIIGGDLIDAPTKLNKYDVFHLKNIEIIEQLDVENIELYWSIQY